MATTPTTAKAWVVESVGAAPVLKEVALPETGPRDVVLKVVACGVCYSDHAIASDEWGMSTYPAVCGHEVVGVVVAIGAAVPTAIGGDAGTAFQTGQRYGLGWNSDACDLCLACKNNQHQHCDAGRPTILGGRIGGFSEYVVAPFRFLVPIPENLASEVAAPMLCGGISVFTPLLRYGVTAGTKVVVYGLGGLGSMAVLFASAMGAEVTVVTRSASKRDDAIKFGATTFISTAEAAEKGENPYDAIADSIDLFLFAASAFTDETVQAAVGALRIGGNIHVLAGFGNSPAIPLAPLAFKSISISGSITGNPADMSRMLEFAADKKINLQITTYPHAELVEALANTAASKARYRNVIVY